MLNRGYHERLFPRSEAHYATVISKLTLALQQIHRQGIVHRCVRSHTRPPSLQARLEAPFVGSLGEGGRPTLQFQRTIAPAPLHPHPPRPRFNGAAT
jgi:hypothetical protein